MDRIEKLIILYSSVVMAVLLNSARLLAIRGKTILSHFWEFNAAEYTFQLLTHFGFCCLLFWLNLKPGLLSNLRNKKDYLTYALLNFVFCFLALFVIGTAQRAAFNSELFRGLYWAAYFGRIGLSGVLIGILIKVILLMRESKQHIIENEQLKNAYTTAELELLKEQINPHFLFNSLSTLSGVIREDPALAQQYVKHLSKVFRYTLDKTADKLVTLAEEFAMIDSFAELLKMRMEDSFKLKTDILPVYHTWRLPHLSLQPLLENAAKHNVATISRPLIVKMYMENDELVISNNLQPVVAESTGIGLVNLNERFRILMDRELTIFKTTDTFTVKLPLQHE